MSTPDVSEGSFDEPFFDEPDISTDAAEPFEQEFPDIEPFSSEDPSIYRDGTTS